MNKDKKITVAHVRKAVKLIKDEEAEDYVQNNIGYDQAEWCGTSCCVMGHAGLIAGRYTLRDMTFNGGIGTKTARKDAEKTAIEWEESANELKHDLGRRMCDSRTGPEDFDEVFEKHAKKKA